MAKFRKKPVVIEATQFWINSPDGWPQGVYKDSTSPTGYRIDTLEGSHEVTNGDWIITGVKGEHYPCKPDIFEMTYESADDNDFPLGKACDLSGEGTCEACQ